MKNSAHRRKLCIIIRVIHGVLCHIMKSKKNIVIDQGLEFPYCVQNLQNTVLL
jgi:hypothetical protein